jgi:uncharacterized protein (TIGR02596 family)
VLDKFSMTYCDGGVSRRSACPSGFTLLEVVLALAVSLILVCLSVMGYTRVIEAAAVESAGSLVSDTLTEARQDAVTQNNTVEVRFYAAPSGTAFDALQLRWHNTDGTTPAVAAALLLPTAAVIDATPVHSSLVTTNTQTPAVDATDPRLNNLTRCFHFLPDGSTDLAATGQWMVTIRAAAQSDPAHFPANWACVTVDPQTGRMQVYRP